MRNPLVENAELDEEVKRLEDELKKPVSEKDISMAITVAFFQAKKNTDYEYLKKILEEDPRFLVIRLEDDRKPEKKEDINYLILDTLGTRYRIKLVASPFHVREKYDEGDSYEAVFLDWKPTQVVTEIGKPE